MSRSGYSDHLDNWQLIIWRGAVASAIRGKRGQEFLKEMLVAFDALSEKELIAHELQGGDKVCAIGAVGAKRGVDMSRLDPEDRDAVADAFGIAPAMAAEITYMNDEAMWGNESPEARFTRMREWIVAQIKPEPHP